MKISYTPTGTCSRLIEIDIDPRGIITDMCVTGGCNGNLQGISALCRGRKASEVADALRGLTCGNKGTSCPDQIACAIQNALANG